MNFALLGDDPAVLPLVRAIGVSSPTAEPLNWIVPESSGVEPLLAPMTATVEGVAGVLPLRSTMSAPLKIHSPEFGGRVRTAMI